MVKAEYILNDEDEVKEIYKILGYSREYKKRDYIIFLIISVVLCNGGAPPWAVAVTCILFIMCFLPYYIYVFCIFYSNFFNKPDKLLGEMLKYQETAVYKFFYYEFFVQFGKDKNIVKKSIEYTKLIYAVETPEYFLLYETRKSGYIIRKNSFTEGNSWDVSKVLKTHLGNRFAVKK